MAALNKLLRPTLIKAASLYSAPITTVDRPFKQLKTSHFSSLCAAKNYPSMTMTRDIHTSKVLRSHVVPFKLSDIGEGIAEVTIKEWYVSVGDEVAQFDNICEVQSDKATVTITCRYDGVVKAIHHEIDSSCKVGQSLIDIEVSEDEVENVSPSVDSKTPMEEPVKEPPKVIEVESERKEILTTPAVRKMAADNKVDLSKITPTGKGGRITKDDLINYMNNDMGPAAEVKYPVYSSPPEQSQPPPPPVVTIPTAHFYNATTYMADTQASTSDRTEEIKGIAKVMVRTMTAAQAVPRFSFHDEYNVDNILKLKKIMKSIGKEHKVKMTFMPLLIKATSMALLKYPMVNAHVNADCSEITYKASHNIGIATDTPHGLMVPNIKNVQNLSIIEIAHELARLKYLSENNKLSTDDVTGGTISLSNVGAIGGTYATPMLVVPEVCIGAFGKVQTIPTYDDEGDIVPRNIMCVSWCGDHRVLDGATVARFSNVLRATLESPASLMFSLK